MDTASSIMTAYPPVKAILTSVQQSTIEEEKADVEDVMELPPSPLPT